MGNCTSAGSYAKVDFERLSPATTSAVNSSSFLHKAASPSGPWTPLPGLDQCNNPAPMLHSNGSIFCGCNRGSHILFYRADSVEALDNGQWVQVTDIRLPTTWEDGMLGALYSGG